MSTSRTRTLALVLTVASVMGISQTASFPAFLNLEAACLLVGRIPSSNNEVTMLNGGIASNVSPWKPDALSRLLPARGGREEVRK